MGGFSRLLVAVTCRLGQRHAECGQQALTWLTTSQHWKNPLTLQYQYLTGLLRTNTNSDHQGYSTGTIAEHKRYVTHGRNAPPGVESYLLTPLTEKKDVHYITFCNGAIVKWCQINKSQKILKAQKWFSPLMGCLKSYDIRLFLCTMSTDWEIEHNQTPNFHNI